LFEDAIFNGDGFVLGETTSRIARETGLSTEQVRDALFGPSADAWRRALTLRAGRG
jgi:hypothetical protein